MPSNSMTVINYNRNQLQKRDKFKHTLGGYDPDKKTVYNLPNATTKQLKEIRKRLKVEHNLRMTKVVILTLILSLVLVLIFGYMAQGAIGLITY